MSKFPYTSANKTFELIKEHNMLYQFVTWFDANDYSTARVFTTVEKNDLPKDFETMFLAPVNLINHLILGKKTEFMKISSIIKFLEDHNNSIAIGNDQTFAPWSVEDEYNLLINEKIEELLDIFDENRISYFGKVILGIQNTGNNASVIHKSYSSYKTTTTDHLKNIGILVNSSDSISRHDAAEELRQHAINVLKESRFS